MSLAPIVEAKSSADFAAGKSLIEAYAAELGIDLCFQNLAEELSNLSSVYGPPHGVLLLARQASDFVGCVGVRRLEEKVCEMKRLYVKPDRRGIGLGRRLALAAIDHARLLGYRRMVLDTLSSMSAALTLYQSLGFRETEPYYDNPLEGVRYFTLDLVPN